MEKLITLVFHIMSRIVLLTLGLVFVASLVFAAAFVFMLWSLRSLWARLRGEPVAPLAFRFNPRAQWGRFHAHAKGAPTDKGAGGATGAKGAIPDITDVVAKEDTTDSKRDSQ